MYLQKLEIQGFKSFANKNVLVFPGMLDATKRGITAVVGPNGSGKSNIADSVRWALGEQSMKTLRGKKSEDVIFSGSDKKSGLAMCEVSLFLNNDDRQAPIDYSEVVITRRLYKSGESEYLINNGRARLYDIQMLLAKAKFGQKTYSVIGQGVVEGFLNTSLSERKEFFDEATGVKQYQIKRDDSLNKLLLSYDNLRQVKMLLMEIEPRLRSLTRQVNRLRRRDEIETELKAVQTGYYAKLWHDIHSQFTSHNEKFLGLEKIKLEKEKKLAALSRELGQLETDNESLSNLAALQEKLTTAQNEKDLITKELARLEAELELKLESTGQFDLSWLHHKQSELNDRIRQSEMEIMKIAAAITAEQEKTEVLNREKAEIEKKIKTLNELILSAPPALDEAALDRAAKHLNSCLVRLEELQWEQDFSVVRSQIKEIKDHIAAVMELVSAPRPRQNPLAAQNELISLNEAKDKLANGLSETAQKSAAVAERRNLLEEQLANNQKELRLVIERLGKTAGEDKISAEQAEKKNRLAVINAELESIKNEMEKLSARETEKRARFFSLQKNIQSLQDEVNRQSTELNEIKVSSTRYETRLEDLEKEIRQSYGDLVIIREAEVPKEINLEETTEKISALKRQMDLIGGIDPEIEKEYSETKNRYDFLFTQSNDLEETIKSLDKVITELDMMIKERFDAEFNVIAKKFDEYFKVLFNGGSGKIVKVMVQDAAEEEAPAPAPQNGQPAPASDKVDAEKAKMESEIKKIKFLQKHNATGLAGIEIQAIPPGKKIKSIAMLSGGERALTAIALVCAIISANPSPFVVLDEVDAALDEANSERLAKILDDLSHKTQFIVITHNRASMRRANIIYGITMGDDGVSKLLSIKFDEAEKVIED